MNGSVSLVGGHMDYFYECEICGKKDGYKRADGRNYPIHIHSQNPVGVENMRAIIKRNGWEEV